MSVCLSLLVGLSLVPQDKTSFTSPQLGLMFDYPKTWKQTSRRDVHLFDIPLEGGTRATLEIRAISFESEKERWQEVQKRINEQLRKEVERQWEELVLGVPFLMTRVRGQEDGRPAITLTGLLYTGTARKMLVKLWAAPEDFERTELEFRELLNTLRTVDGRLPTPEDPTKPPEVLAARPEPPKTLPRRLPGAGKERQVVKGPVGLEVVVSQRKAVLRVPEGFVLSPTEDGVQVSHPQLAKPLLLTLHTTLDSDRPDRALIRASAASLERFKTVTSRRDSTPAPNLAGATLATVWRVGETTGGTATTLEAVGLVDVFYWMLSSAWEGEPSPAERKVIEMLMDGASLEAAP
ncbi:MAG TPA: hypothetical protein VM328_05730 [Fimbriimonadaceae bacterium]|nr:hypothetical protein [Fimbriimonadaceae bacterium]